MSLDLHMREMIELFHQEKNPALGMEHIKRLRLMATDICQNTGIPREEIMWAIFFHGLNVTQQDEVESTFISFGKSPQEARKYRELSTFIGTDKTPASPEEKVLHDCHVLEGGRYFGIIRSVLNGVHHEQSIGESLVYYENDILPNLRCYLTYTKRLLKQKREFMITMIQDLKEYV